MRQMLKGRACKISALRQGLFKPENPVCCNGRERIRSEWAVARPLRELQNAFHNDLMRTAQRPQGMAMSSIAKRLACAAALARKAPRSIASRISATARRGLRLLRDDLE